MKMASFSLSLAALAFQTGGYMVEAWLSSNPAQLKQQPSLSSLSLSSDSNNEATTPSAPSRRGFLQHSAQTALFTTTALVTATTTTATPALAAPPAIGTKAPSFDLPNSRGDGTTSLNSLVDSGKWTVLYFYPGAFTTGCTLEAKSFQRDLEEYRKLGAQIVGVSVDPPEKNAQFCTSTGLDFFMLSDVGGTVSKLYGSALSIPGFGSFSNRQTYLIDPKGNLRHVFTDVESRIARHSQEVLEKLNELAV